MLVPFQDTYLNLSTYYRTSMLSRYGILAFSSLLLVGCGASAVPELRSEDLHLPALPGITPRTVRLLVFEHRSPTPEETEETMARVRTAVAGTLKRAGVELSQESPNELSVAVAYPERTVEGFSRESCIQMTGRLSPAGQGFAQASATRCFEWRHLLGFSIGGDSSKTFQAATNDMLEQLDVQLSRLPPPVAQ